MAKVNFRRRFAPEAIEASRTTRELIFWQDSFLHVSQGIAKIPGIPSLLSDFAASPYRHFFTRIQGVSGAKNAATMKSTGRRIR